MLLCLLYAVSERQSAPTAPTPPAPTPAPGDNTGVIIGVIIVIIVVVALILLLVLGICWLWYRNKRLGKKGIYSPRHFAEQTNTMAPTDTLELKYAGNSPTHFEETPDPLFSTAAVEKEAEACMASDPAPVPPVTATPTEGELVGTDGGRWAGRG